MRLTSATFVTEIGKSPNVSQTNRVAYACQHKLHFVFPMRSFRLSVLFAIVVVETRTCRQIVLCWPLRVCCLTELTPRSRHIEKNLRLLTVRHC